MADIINNNIYGGAIIPSSFVFDFVHFGSYKTLTDNDDWNFMAIGRHCLIKYCNYAFTTEERKTIETGSEPSDKNSNEYLYYTCFVADSKRSYDGLIVQKTETGPLMIGYTNHGLSTEYADSQFATDFKTALNEISNATENLNKAVETVDDLSEQIGTASDADKTIYGRINQIEQNISNTNTKVDSNSTEIDNLEEQVSSINETINKDLAEHINDFNSRTTWKEGVTLSLGTELPKDEEDASGRLTVVDDNIYYNKQILSRNSWFNKAETAGAKYGAFPQIQVEGIKAEDLKNIPVKIYIGSTAPTSTEKDVTIWIKT